MKAVVIFLRIVIVVLVVTMLSGGFCYFKTNAATRTTASFQTASVKRGDLISTISATGTLEAEEVVNVGSQVSGRIVQFGKDRRSPNKTVDYESVVEKGDLLAKIDSTVYEVTLEQAKATLAQSQANLMQYQAKFKQAEQERKRGGAVAPQTSHRRYGLRYGNSQPRIGQGQCRVGKSHRSAKRSRSSIGAGQSRLLHHHVTGSRRYY